MMAARNQGEDSFYRLPELYQSYIVTIYFGGEHRVCFLLGEVVDSLQSELSMSCEEILLKVAQANGHNSVAVAVDGEIVAREVTLYYLDAVKKNPLLYKAWST